MPQTKNIDFSNTEMSNVPFPHFTSASVLHDDLIAGIYEWFESTEAWGLTEMDFYTQFEFSLFDVEVPPSLQTVMANSTISEIIDAFKQNFNLGNLELVGLTAHKLVNGHKIGVHNDFIGSEETHRLVLQINPGWEDSKGGYLMLFTSPNAEDVSNVVQPINNSAFGFEISDKSYHAVSTVYDFSRYTIVYTFKAGQ